MGLLVDGKWVDRWYDTKESSGRFVRQDAKWRDWVNADGRPAEGRERGFRAEPDRYHLYVSLACPWAHRTLIFRELKGLVPHISLDVVHPFLGRDGWSFDTDFPGATGDRLLGKPYLRDIYVASDPRATTRVTVPVLWDKASGSIVSNESAEIIRMLNSAFDGITGNTDDFTPADLLPEIDAVNARVYDGVNNGVYRAGFARSQEAYDEAAAGVFETLDWIEERLGRERYLVGGRLTEADWRLATTLFRFDLVYHGHFKCNRRRIVDYPNLWAYARELSQVPKVAGTVNYEHIARHYYTSHESINPTRIVPIGPDVDWREPHGRGRRAAA
jgi:putative glutathione S-transferase